MKTLAFNITSIILFTIVFNAVAQAPDTTKRPSRWEKKFLIGATFDNGLNTITGTNLPSSYFSRPGLGGSIKAEYYFTKHIGITAGVAFETRGAGIITPDLVKDLGNPDSTHRARIKFLSLEVPVALVLRGFEPIRGTRLHVEGGITPSRNMLSRYIFLSIEDGFHLIEDQSAQYYKTDLLLHAVVGLDINAADACIFQVHFIGNWGTRNVYGNSFSPSADGRNRMIGIRLGWIF